MSETTNSVAVAVIGSTDGDGSGQSRRAVIWAVQNLLPSSHRFILVHAMPKITSIPTPSGVRIPVEEVNSEVVEMYVKDTKLKLGKLFIPYQKLCKPRKVETLVVEGDNPALALLTYISESGVKFLVLGSDSSNCILRRLKASGIPSIILRYAPQSCSIYVVSKQKLVTKLANSSISETISRNWIFSGGDVRRPTVNDRQLPESKPSTSVVDITTFGTVSTSSSSDASYWIFNNPAAESANDQICRQDSRVIKRGSDIVSTSSIQSDVQAEIEQLRLELQETGTLYKQACEELVLAQNKVKTLSSEYLNETRKANSVLQREETLKRKAAEEKTNQLEAMKKVELAKNLLEASERKLAEVNAHIKSPDLQKVTHAIISADWIYRKYSKDEIEVATAFFSEDKVIGEGGYGKVYGCSLDNTPVAIKVLHSDASHRKEEFLKEIEVLSRLRHPHIVLLIGACPENYCLVYEYMENGSLEDHILTEKNTSPLPWFVRFRIAFELACGLSFLHNSMPEPIVHRDLKPGNILLDKNFVTKIGDVGLAKFILEDTPDNITLYKESILAGTLCYMDPEYQRTGTVRPKSDVYAFGVIILQLLTGRDANGLILTVENAIAKGSFADKLDKSVKDWPLVEVEELAQIAVKCCGLRCRDRPDLDTELLPVLKRLVDFADASIKFKNSDFYAPSHYFCPILQKVMEDPYIAADGFTYEQSAIKEWLEKHDVSPVTKLKMKHTWIIQNHTLLAALQAWRSHATSSHSSFSNKN